MILGNLKDFKEINDILLELNSPKLREDIEKSRDEYFQGKTADFEEFVLGLE